MSHNTQGSDLSDSSTYVLETAHLFLTVHFIAHMQSYIIYNVNIENCKEIKLAKYSHLSCELFPGDLQHFHALTISRF